VAKEGRVLYANSLYHMTNDAAVASLPALFPLLVLDLGFGPAVVGFVTAAALVVTVAFQIVLGGVSDRGNAVRYLHGGILLLGAATALIYLAPDLTAFVALILVSRIGASVYHPVGIAWISREYPGGARDTAMGIQSSFGDLGVILGVMGSGLLGTLFGWREAFLFWGALNLSAVAATVVFVRGLRAEAPRPSAAPNPARPLAVLRDVRLWIVPLAVGGAAFTIIITFVPLFLTDPAYGMGLTTLAADVATGTWLVLGTVLAFSFGRISRRLGRYPSLLLAYLAVAGAGVLLAVQPNVPAVLLALTAFGSLLFLTFPALFALIADSTDARLRGFAFGVIFGFQLLGGAAASAVAGVLFESFGPPATFVFLSALAFATFLFLLAARSRVPTPRNEAT
jgi:MFS family permease